MKRILLIMLLTIICCNSFCDDIFYLDKDKVQIAVENRIDLGFIDVKNIKYLYLGIDYIKLEFNKSEYCIMVAAMNNTGIKQINQLVDESGVSTFEFTYKNEAFGYGIIQLPIKKSEVLWIVGDKSKYQEIIDNIKVDE